MERVAGDVDRFRRWSMVLQVRINLSMLRLN